MGGCYSKRAFSFRKKKRTQKQLPRIIRIDWNGDNSMYTNRFMLQTSQSESYKNDNTMYANIEEINDELVVVDNTYEYMEAECHQTNQDELVVLDNIYDDIEAECHQTNQNAHKGRVSLEQTRRLSTDSSMYEAPVVNQIHYTDETSLKTHGSVSDATAVKTITNYSSYDDTKVKTVYVDSGSDETNVKTVDCGSDGTNVKTVNCESDGTNEKTIDSGSDETNVKTVYCGSDGTNVKTVDCESDGTNVKTVGDNFDETNVNVSTGYDVKIDAIAVNTIGMETVGGGSNHERGSNSRMPTYNIDTDAESVKSSDLHTVEVSQPLFEANTNDVNIHLTRTEITPNDVVVQTPTMMNIPICCYGDGSISVGGAGAQGNKSTETNDRLTQLENEKEQLKRRIKEKKIRRLEREIKCLQSELDTISSDDESDCQLSTKVKRERIVNPTETNAGYIQSEEVPLMPVINSNTDKQEQFSGWESWFVPSRDWTAHVPLQSMADNSTKLSDNGSQLDLFQIQISTSASFMDIL